VGDAPPEDIRRLVLEEGRSRMPVYDGTLDEVVGYVMAKDLAAMAWERQLVVLDDLLRPAHFVPESARAVTVLRDLQRRRAHLAVVVDEHGGTAGLLTLEDLLEELVGEIVGEEEEPHALFQREADGSVLVRGDALVRELNRALGIALPEGDDYSTVGGLCVALAGAVPEPGARLTAADGTGLEVLEASARVVRRIRLTPRASPPPAP
jgi:putative hemolysin